MRITSPQIRYLLAIYELASKGERVGSAKIAKRLGVSRASVSNMLNTLAAMGLIEKEHYGKARLTDEGLSLIQSRLLEIERISSLLQKTVNVGPACAYECALFVVCEKER